MTIFDVDEITNDVMDCIRDEFGLDSESDRDDALYSKIHNIVREALL